MASKTMDFEWNYSIGGIVSRKGFGPDINAYFAQTLLDYGEQYTPMLSGNLRGSAFVTTSGDFGAIEYGAEYANYQYSTPDETWSRATAGTSGAEHGYSSSNWLDYAWLVHKRSITSKVGAYRRWHSV